MLHVVFEFVSLFCGSLFCVFCFLFWNCLPLLAKWQRWRQKPLPGALLLKSFRLSFFLHSSSNPFRLSAPQYLRLCVRIYFIVQLYLLLMRNCMRAKTLKTFASLYFLIRVLLHLRLKLRSIVSLPERGMLNAGLKLSCHVFRFEILMLFATLKQHLVHTSTYTTCKAHFECILKLARDQTTIEINCNNF